MEELLSKAENIDLSLYTEESGNVLKAAIADAEAIFEDENATEKQVAYASDLLAKAMDGLKTAESKEPTDDKSHLLNREMHKQVKKMHQRKTNGCEDRGYNNDVCMDSCYDCRSKHSDCDL